MKQSTRLISERRVRAYILWQYGEDNPDNKPREISRSVIDSLDIAIRELISDMIYHAPVENGRLNHSGFFSVEYLPGEKP